MLTDIDQKATWGRTRFIPVYNAQLSPYPLLQEVSTGIWRRELKQRLWKFAAY